MLLQKMNLAVIIFVRNKVSDKEFVDKLYKIFNVGNLIK